MGQVLAKALFWAADCQHLALFSHGGRDEGHLWGLFYKGTNRIHEGSGLVTKSPPRCHTSCHYLGHWVFNMNLGKGANIQYIAMILNG